MTNLAPSKKKHRNDSEIKMTIFHYTHLNCGYLWANEFCTRLNKTRQTEILYNLNKLKTFTY